MPDASQGVASDGGGQPGTFAVDGGPVRARAGWAWCAVAGLLLMLTTLAAAPAHAQGICGRTVAVHTAILAEIAGVSDCADVTTSHLAAITGELNLGGLRINALAMGDFAGLTGVTTLVLSDNDLITLPSQAFAGLTSLTVLWLDRNALLTTLPDRGFTVLTSLTKLVLSTNALTDLPADIFEGLTSLEELLLDGNAPLTTLPPELFAGLTSLKLLELRANGLTELPAGVFDGLTS